MKSLSRIVIAAMLMILTVTGLLARPYDEIIKSGKLIVGVVLDVPPFGYVEKGINKGIDIEIARFIAKEMGIKIKFKKLKVKERIEALENDEVDLVIATFSITSERDLLINFSVPYYTTGVGIMVKASNSDIHSYKHLAEKRVGVILSSVSEKTIEKLVPDAELISFRDQPSMDKALDDNHVEAIVDDKVLLDYRSHLKGSNKYRVLERMNPDPYGVGVNKNYPKLLKKLNDIMDKIRTQDPITRISRLKEICSEFDVPMTEREIETDVGLSTNDVIHNVRSGETLSSIAAQYYNDVTKWEIIFEANRDKIEVPSLIEPGLRLRIPKITAEKIRIQIRIKQQKISQLQEEIRKLEAQLETLNKSN